MSPNEGQLDLDNNVVLFTGTNVPVFLPGGRQALCRRPDRRTQTNQKWLRLMRLINGNICIVSVKETYKVGHLYKVSSRQRFHQVGALACL